MVKKYFNRNSNFATAQFAKLFAECPALGLGHVPVYLINVTIELPVTSPQKLLHMVTSPQFEKVRGDVGIVGKCVGMRG